MNFDRQEQKKWHRFFKGGNIFNIMKERWLSRTIGDYTFIEADGLILLGPLERYPISAIDGDNWEVEYSANHVHSNVCANDLDRVREELKIVSSLENALKEAYPTRKFVIAHAPGNTVTFYQSEPGSPIGGVFTQEQPIETSWCQTCGANVKYHSCLSPKESPESEWGLCITCGTLILLGQIEVLTFVGPE